MRSVVYLLGFALIGCSSPAQEAERSYQTVSGAGSAVETCEAARKVAQAYADEGDRESYARWKQTQEQDCAVARLSGH